MKKKISAEIIADSKNEAGDRITTFVLTFPRIILAELNTHRVFSRNSASSRAIPFKRMLEMVTEDPFIPMAWQKDHSGMQGSEYLEDREYSVFDRDGIMGHTISPNECWLNARDSAVNGAYNLNQIGATKQLCNRLLEPFMWHTAIVTSTEFENFFKQRCPQYELEGDSSIAGTYRSKADYLCAINKTTRDAGEPDHMTVEDMDTVGWLSINKGQGEIHIMELAEQMWDAMNENTPNELKAGEWHIPFGDKMDEDKLEILGNKIFGVHGSHYVPTSKEVNEVKIKIATARCARISYLNFDGTDDYEKDIKLHDRLSTMLHWSPFEHCAKAMSNYDKSPMILKMKTSEMSGSEKDQILEKWRNHGKLTGLMIFDSKHNPEIIHVDDMSRNFKGFIQYRSIVEKS